MKIRDLYIEDSDFCSDVSFELTNMWLMICQPMDEDEDDVLPCTASVELFYWPDLLQEAVGHDHVAKRSINTNKNCSCLGGGINKTKAKGF
jgi:hypothetical protein